jgi:hypothetical protein
VKGREGDIIMGHKIDCGGSGSRPLTVLVLAVLNLRVLMPHL